MDLPEIPNEQQLVSILSQIISGQNASELEKYFKKYLKNPQSVQDLFNQMINNTEPQIRQLASVLLRKKINFHWQNLPSETQTHIKQSLINQITNEPEAIVRKNIASLVAALGSFIISTWPELLTFINTCVESDSVAAKEIGLYLLAELMESEVACEFLKPYQENLVQLFAKSLSDTSSREIRKNAMKALGNHSTSAEDTESVKYIVDLIPQMMNVLNECLEAGDEELVVFSFVVFDGLLDSGHSLAPHLDLIVRVAIEKVGVNKDLSINTRESAIDFLETLADTNPKILGNSPDSLRYLLQHIFSIAGESDYNSEDESACDMGFRLLDTLAIALPNKKIYPMVMEFVSQLVGNQNPAYRRVGVLTYGIIAEGCADYLKQNLKEIVNTLVAALNDENQVKEAAGLSLGYCAEHLKPDILEFHEQIIPPLTGVLSSATTKSKHKVIYAIDSFCENFEEEIETYLQGLVQTLTSLILNDPDTQVKQMSLSALSSCISSAESKITPYFVELAQMLGSIIHAQQADLTVRSTALQCLGSLASCTTTESFSPYLQDSLNLAFSYLQSQTLEMREAAFAFFYNLAKLLKGSMEAYADQVLNEAIKSLESKEGLRIAEVGDLSDSEEEEDSGFKLRSIYLDEKTAAMHAIGHLALECPSKVVPYIESIAQKLSDLFSYFHENIRMQCVTTSQEVIEGLIKLPNGFANAQELWFNYTYPQYLTILDKDDSKEAVCRVLEAIENLCPKVGTSLLPEAQMNSLVEKLKALLNETAACQREGDETEGDHDELIMGDLTDTIQALAKTWGEGFKPYLLQLLPLFSKFTGDSRNSRDRNLFAGCLADTLKHIPSLASEYSNEISGLAVRNIQSGEEYLYRNSVYLLGVLCEVVPNLASSYSQYLGVIEKLFTEEQEPGVKDNAVAAVCRMIYTSPNAVPLSQVLTYVFKEIPLKEDYEEMETVLKCLVFLYENNYEMGNNEGLTLQVFMDGIITQSQKPDKYKLNNEVLQRIKTILKGLKDTPAFQEVGSKLSVENQQLLSQILSN